MQAKQYTSAHAEMLGRAVTWDTTVYAGLLAGMPTGSTMSVLCSCCKAVWQVIAAAICQVADLSSNMTVNQVACL